jgi:1-phosphatidylinositol-3-phosphate 5-kinase
MIHSPRNVWRRVISSVRNTARRRIADRSTADVIFDSSACHAHREYAELGVMKLFSSFGKVFLKEYHWICPKTEPVDQYDHGIALYGL